MLPSNSPPTMIKRLSVPSSVAAGPVIKLPSKPPKMPAPTNKGKSRLACRASHTSPAVVQTIVPNNAPMILTLSHRTG